MPETTHRRHRRLGLRRNGPSPKPAGARPRSRFGPVRADAAGLALRHPLYNYKNMSRRFAAFLVLILPCAAFAQAPVSLHASYDTYAAGVRAAVVEAGFSFGPSTYRMNLGYHTTGMVGFFFRGHQFDMVNGTWRGTQPVPTHFLGEGLWRGQERLAEIDYVQGAPRIRQLVPANVNEREPVPETLQANTVDTLSALAGLIRTVGETGRCETTARTFDGRRAVEIEAHTVDKVILEPTGRSTFSGPALHCAFSGRMLAGFKFDDDRGRDGKPMRGSAWLASVAPNAPPLPVRLTFETRWFGDATMYLTGIGPGADIKIAKEE